MLLCYVDINCLVVDGLNKFTFAILGTWISNTTIQFVTITIG